MDGIVRKFNLVPGVSKLKKSELEYYLFFIVIEFGEALNIGSGNKLYLALAATGIFFLLFKLADTRFNKQELFFIILLSALAILIYYSSRKFGGILSILALIGLKGVDIKKLLKLSFYIRLTSFISLICLSSFGIIQNTVISNLRGDSTIVRYSMGFSHPNQFHLAYIILLLLCIYLYYDKMGILQISLLGALNIVLYYLSHSRTSALIGFLAISLLIWFKSKSFPKIKNCICMGILPFGFLISLIPSLLYDKLPNIRTIDNLLQWRITFSRHYLSFYPMKLFGNNLGGDPTVLDSGYVELVINYGLIFTFLYLSAFMLLAYRCIKEKKDRELLFIVCFAVYGITEAFIPNLFTNLSMIFIGELIFNRQREKVS